MKNIILAVICFLSLNFKAQDRPTCCNDKCSKECIETCKKNKCTSDKECLKNCGTKNCYGATCSKKASKCCADTKTCKKNCAAGKCDDLCKATCEKEGKSCCKK